MSWVVGTPGKGPAPPELHAARAGRLVRVLVLLDSEIEGDETRKRVRAAVREGETRVYVPWPLRWRILTNLERWSVRGVSVAGW